MAANITSWMMNKKVDYLSDEGKAYMEQRLPVGTLIHIYSSSDCKAPVETWKVARYERIKRSPYGDDEGWLCYCECINGVMAGTPCYKPATWSLQVAIRCTIENWRDTRININNQRPVSECMYVPNYYVFAEQK